MSEEKTTLKDKVYSAILNGIFDNEYKPQQILTEKELIEKFQCSKSSVREALISLCNENVLRSIPRYGYEVIKIDMEDVKNILDIRYLLEGGFLKANFKNFNTLQTNILKKLDEKCRRSGLEIWEHWDANARFHLELIAFSQNDRAYKELTSIMKFLKRAYSQSYWKRWDYLSEPFDTRNHREIIKFIEKKDEKELLKALKRDLMDFGTAQLSLTDFF